MDHSKPAITWISGRDPALDHLAESIIMMVEAVALCTSSVKHSNQLTVAVFLTVSQSVVSSSITLRPLKL